MSHKIYVCVCVCCVRVYIYTDMQMYKYNILIVSVLAVAPPHINTHAHDHFSGGCDLGCLPSILTFTCTHTPSCSLYLSRARCPSLALSQNHGARGSVLSLSLPRRFWSSDKRMEHPNRKRRCFKVRLCTLRRLHDGIMWCVCE